MKKRYLCLLWLVAFPWRAEAASLLIEAEDYTKKVSDAKGFASKTRERAASGRHVLLRFFMPGHVLYTFTLPEDGEYAGWLRYGAKQKQRIGVCVDPKGKPSFKQAELEATGGYIGPGVWQWGKLFKTHLAAGTHTLALANASMRVDCIYITTGEAQPVDDVISSGPPKLTPDQRKLLAKPLAPVRPKWIDEGMGYELPEWYTRYRVHAHTRLGPRSMNRDIFFKAARAFKQMGVHTFARHIKSGSEGAWWPSKVGAILPQAQDRNIAKEIIGNAHREGMRILVYHRHMEDAHVAKTHPDWMCRDPQGKPYKRRGYMICLNSPYPDYFVTRALELVDLGADAFYFDEVHMPKTGCWCAFCKAAFKRETGLDHPKAADPDDPVWHRLIDFNNVTIERTFLKWRRAIHERNPKLVMLIGSNTYPTMGERTMTQRLFRIADSMKTEFSLPARAAGSRIFGWDKSIKPTAKDVRLAMGYTLARDAVGGRPAHVWTHGLLNEASSLYAVAGMVTHGCIANLDISEPTIPNMMFRKAFELGDRVSPAFAGTRPMRWAVVHYSEHARDQYLLDESARWKKAIYPAYGAYHVLLRALLPVGIITDSQLEDGLLDGYKLLFLPAPQHLTEPMRASVARFKQRGGTVIEQQPDWLWHDPEGGQERAMDAFKSRIENAAQSAPVQVLGGPEKMHAVPHVTPDGKRLTVSLANDFSWVYTGRKRTRDGTKIDLTPYLTPPADCAGVRVVIRGGRTPKSVREVVSDKPLRWTMSEQVVEIDAPAFAHMAVLVAEFD